MYDMGCRAKCCITKQLDGAPGKYDNTLKKLSAYMQKYKILPRYRLHIL